MNQPIPDQSGGLREDPYAAPKSEIGSAARDSRPRANRGLRFAMGQLIGSIVIVALLFAAALYPAVLILQIVFSSITAAFVFYSLRPRLEELRWKLDRIHGDLERFDQKLRHPRDNPK